MGEADGPGPKDLQHPRFARAYERVLPEMDERGAQEHRRKLLRGLSGRVLELGAGTGATFGLYPPEVTEVVALEPDDYLRGIALTNAARASVPVTVASGRAEDIPADDGSFDAVVSSLVLCSVNDQAAALKEVRRVLRPGGLFVFYEHIRSGNRLIATLEDLVAPLWSLLAGGCHPNRDTVRAVSASGFDVEQTEEFGFSVQRGTPAAAHVIGRAHPRTGN